ncbi:alpha-2-macroglobulin-like protein 1 [Pelodytes ibericus]
MTPRRRHSIVAKETKKYICSAQPTKEMPLLSDKRSLNIVGVTADESMLKERPKAFLHCSQQPCQDMLVVEIEACELDLSSDCHQISNKTGRSQKGYLISRVPFLDHAVGNKQGAGYCGDQMPQVRGLVLDLFQTSLQFTQSTPPARLHDELTHHKVANTVALVHYGFFVPSMLYYPSDATFCIYTDGYLGKYSSLKIILETESGSRTLHTIEKENNPFHCPTFQVPVPSGAKETGIIKVEGVTGGTTHQLCSKSVKISRMLNGTFIQTDKAVYKPGQKVMARIVTLNQNHEAVNKTYGSIYMQDPMKNRVNQWNQVSSKSGIVEISHQLSTEPVLGKYTLGTESSILTFTVEEYVLPKFEMAIQTPSCVSIHDTTATISACAKYTYGQAVPGTMTLKICQKKQWSYWRYRGEEIKNICHLHTAKNDRSGCLHYTANLTNFRMRDSDYNRNLHVEAWMEEEGTGVQINATAKQCEIVSRITKLSFKDSKSYFQPGAPYKGKLFLETFDGKPLGGRKVHITASSDGKSTQQTFETDSSGEASFQLSTAEWGKNSVSLKAITDDKDEGYERHRVATRYGSSYLYLKDIYVNSPDYVYIHPMKSSAPCHANVTVKVDYNLQRTGTEVNFHYLVLSKNRIVAKGQQRDHKAASPSGSMEISLPVRDISPSGKMMVFTVSDSGAVAADTMTYQVTPCLKQDVSLQFSENKVLPGSGVKLNLRAAPGSLCALRVVDKSVVLMKPEDELTEAKIQNLIKTESPSYYERLSNDLCQDKNPSDSWETDSDGFDIWGSHVYSYPVKKKDIQNLIQEMGLTILTSWNIVAPVTCKYERPGIMPKTSFADSAVMKTHSEEPSGLTSKPRTFFPETLLWNLQSIPSSGSAEIAIVAPDTITEWQGNMFCTGVGSIALSERSTLTTFQPFFVDVSFPFSVKQGETFDLKASVFNYLLHPIQVTITLIQSSVQEKTGNNVHTFCLSAGEKKTVSWRVTPIKIGNINITVTSQAVSSQDLCNGEAIVLPEKGQRDTVTQLLLVKPEGTLVEQTHNSLLVCDGTTVEESVSLDLPETFVEGSEKASVSVFGDIMGPTLNNLENLLAMSCGCGEQNMVLFAPNIFILQYLESSQQLTDEIRQKGKEFLIKGYQRQLSYKHKDGSYSAFGESDEVGNTWLTAFVIKSMAQARPLMSIDEDVINQGMQWLKNQQKPDGGFRARGRLLNNAMKGGVDDEITLTAYITIALLEIGMLPSDPVIDRAMQFMAKASLENASVYKMSLVSYAGIMANCTDMGINLLRKVHDMAIKKNGLTHWTQESKAGKDSFWSKPKSVDVEVTAYNLLAHTMVKPVSKKELGNMVSIVRWLSKQRNANGGFCSTQDTVVALQALTKFGSLSFSKAGNLTVTVSTEEGFRHQVKVNEENRLVMQKAMLPHIPGKYKVSVTGTGSVYIQITQQYHTPPPQSQAAFNLSVETRCTEKSMLEIEVTYCYLGERPSTNMALMEIEMPSGLVPHKEYIKQLKGHELVKRVETTENSITVYLEKVTSEPQKIMVVAEQQAKVADLKPANVKMFDYYVPDEKKTVNYLALQEPIPESLYDDLRKPVP